jgi:hypothetical protein
MTCRVWAVPRAHAPRSTPQHTVGNRREGASQVRQYKLFFVEPHELERARARKHSRRPSFVGRSPNAIYQIICRAFSFSRAGHQARPRLMGHATTKPKKLVGAIPTNKHSNFILYLTKTSNLAHPHRTHDTAICCCPRFRRGSAVFVTVQRVPAVIFSSLRSCGWPATACGRSALIGADLMCSCSRRN